MLERVRGAARTPSWLPATLGVALAALCVLGPAWAHPFGLQQQANKSKPEQNAPHGPVGVQMRNVMYHYTDSIAVLIRRLDGELETTEPGQVAVFDDKQSFTIAINSGEMAISADSLAHVLNDYVFAAHDAPLKGVSLAIVGGRLKVKGRLHSKGDIPFETDGELSATPEGKIRLHAEKVKALKLPVKKLMDLVGVEMQNLISTKKVAGVRVEGDDLILDPEELLPPPHVKGSVTQVRLEGTNIVQTFGHAAAPKAEFRGNYMAYRGALLRFGKLTMNDTDMVLIDMDAADPFDFYLDHYREQLSAGYTKITPQFGLRVYMRDYSKLHAGAGKPK